MKKLSYIGYGIFIALLLIVGGVFLSSKTGFPKTLEIKIVQSGSMEPAIPVGALIFITPFETYQAGDVVTFGEDNSKEIPTTHRVISQREVGSSIFYTTKGDANEENDNKEIPAKDVIGKVFLSIPYAGFVLDFARQPAGFALLIGLPAAIIILDETSKIFKEFGFSGRRRRKEATEDKDDDVEPQRRVYRMDGIEGVREEGGGKLNDVPKFAYVKEMVNDEIFVKRKVILTEPKRSFLNAQTLSLFLVMCSMALSSMFLVSKVGSTVSYFSDVDKSIANILRAGEWESEIVVALDEPTSSTTLLSLASSLGGGELPEEENEENKDKKKEETKVEENAQDSVVASTTQEIQAEIKEEKKENKEESKETAPTQDVLQTNVEENNKEDNSSQPQQEITPPQEPTPSPQEVPPPSEVVSPPTETSPVI